MLEVNKVKQLTGSIELPPNPDYFFLSMVLALTTNNTIKVSPLYNTPLILIFKNIFSNYLNITQDGANCYLSSKSIESHTPIFLPYDRTPFRDFVIALLLGSKHRLSFTHCQPEILDLWKIHCSFFGLCCHIDSSTSDVSIQLTPEGNFNLSKKPIPANTLHRCIGFALGLKKKMYLHLSYHFQSPLRHLLPQFGYDVLVKSKIEKAEQDPLKRRMQLLSPKLKKKNNSKVLFSLFCDFSQPKKINNLSLCLPGDDVFASLILMAKSLISRGQLIIHNVPIEPWNSAMIGFIRKLGCILGIQETEMSSFGATAMISIQKFSLLGHTLKCIPLYQFIRTLPVLVLLSSFAKGQSVFRSLSVLRDESPEYISQILSCVDRIGARFGEMPDGIIIDGAGVHDGFEVYENYSACLNAACVIAGLKCNGKSYIEDTLILERWPGFETQLHSICEF